MAAGTINTGGHISVRPGEGFTSIETIDEVTRILNHSDSIESFSVRSHGRLVIVQDGKTFGSGYATVGIDPVSEDRTSIIAHQQQLVEGRIFRSDERGSIVVGIDLADAAVGNLYDGKHLHIGQVITFRSLSGEERSFSVVGIVDAQYFHPNWSVYFQKDDLEEFDAGKKNDEIAVKLKNPEQLTQVRQDLADRLPGTRVYTWIEREGYVFDVATTFRLITSDVNHFLVFSAFAITVATIFVNVFQKRRQIGVLRSLGISSRSITIVYLLETFVYLLLSSLLGFLMFALVYIFSLQHPISLLTGSFTLQLVWLDVFQLCGAWFLAALLGGFLPTFIVARSKIADILRGV